MENPLRLNPLAIQKAIQNITRYAMTQATLVVAASSNEQDARMFTPVARMLLLHAHVSAAGKDIPELHVFVGRKSVEE